jgi:hypothetical protein
MKKISFILSMLLSVVLQQSFSQDVAVEWKSYGKGVQLDKATPLKSLLEGKEKVIQQEVMVEGIIKESCQSRGCWMVLEDDESSVRVEFENYGFFVPWDSKGKKVKLQGSLKEKTVSASAAKHMAEEMDKPPVQKDRIREKQTITVFLATGVAMEGGSELSDEQLEIIGGAKEHHDHE